MARAILVLAVGAVVILAMVALVFFVMICLAGLSSDAAHKYGTLGKVVGGMMLVGLVPLFKLGMYVARRRRAVRTEHPPTPGQGS